MSSSVIKSIKHNSGNPIVEDLKEFKNSHGTAPVIWDQMAQKYLDLQPFHYSFHTEKLWPLWKDKNIPRVHRAVLLMTYDNAIVLKSDFAEAAKDIRQFLSDFEFNPEHVNHWPAIAEIFESNPDCDGIGFYWTSVGEDPFQGEYDEEKEEYAVADLAQFWSSYYNLRTLD